MHLRPTLPFLGFLGLGGLLLLTSACKQSGSSSAGVDAGGGAGGGGRLDASPAAAATGTASVPTPTFSSGFEGEITMHSSTPRGQLDLTFITKGGKLRVDMPGTAGTHSLFDPATKKVTIIMDTQKLALERAVPVSAPSATKTATISRTGKHETIAGYDCEDWDVVTENGNHATTCVAKGIAFFDFAATAGQGGAGRSLAEELRENNEFPLRAVELDPSGKEVSKMDVTKIEAKPIDDSLFTVPPGFDAMGVHGPVPGIAPGTQGVPHPTHK